MVRAITVEVYEADNTTPVGTLTSDRGRQWLNDLSAEGSYTVESKLDHADEALLTDGRVLRFCIDSSPVWPALVEELNPVIADPSARQAGRVVGAAGRGLLAILERAIIYPELGIGRRSPDTRYFNFASADYDDSDWDNAVELKQQPDPALPWSGAPVDWPDPDAYWVGPPDGNHPGAFDPEGVPPGDIYLRGTFTVAEGLGGEHRFFLTADDGFELYVDGNKEAAEQAAGLWGMTRSFDLLLDEGAHVVAVKVINFVRAAPNDATNAFGFILSVIRMAGGGDSLGDVVARAGSGTAMLPYPDKAPGMTPGKILDVLLTEAQADGRETLPDLTWDFDADEDSDGNPWPDQIDVSFPVGTSVLDVVRHLVDEHACDVAMDPVGLVLHAYVSKGSDLSGTVSAEYGVNVGQLAFRKSTPKANVALSRTAEGRWVESTEASSVSDHGRREIGLTLGSAPSDDAADRQTAAFFADNAFPIEAVTSMQLEPVNAVPYVDFAVGDTISCTDSSGGTSSFRVHGLRVTEDAVGQPIYQPELVKA